MGLNMYLYAYKFVTHEESAIQNNPLTQDLVEAGFNPGPDYWDLPRIEQVRVRVGYWRKAYSINSWLSASLDGDELQRDDLTELKRLCQVVLADPSQRESIFGIDPDDFNFEEKLQVTIDQITEIEKLPDTYGFTYFASY